MWFKIFLIIKNCFWLKNKIFCTNCIIFNSIEFESILQVSWKAVSFINNNAWFMIKIRKFKLSVFNVKLISLSLLFFSESSSKFSDILSKLMMFNLSCHCCSISDNILWKFNVVLEIIWFFDSMKASSDTEFISEASQAWFSLINEEISAVFWLSESVHVFLMIKNVRCNISKFTKS